jgi:hypothetical protein
MAVGLESTEAQADKKTDENEISSVEIFLVCKTSLNEFALFFLIADVTFDVTG